MEWSTRSQIRVPIPEFASRELKKNQNNPGRVASNWAQIWNWDLRNIKKSMLRVRRFISMEFYTEQSKSCGIETLVSKHFLYFVVNQQTHNVKQAKVDRKMFTRSFLFFPKT
jgi:hypothetical protein